ncbi:hypothetical protein MMC22_007996 [Lobaria immixta]|nr:hypothetical protein [Lobaria immixta]
MLFSVLSQAGILSSLIFQTYALPFKPQEDVDRPEAQKRASYSVVEVDGSAANTSPGVATPTIETVTQTLKDTKTITASPIIPSVSKQTITEVVTQSSSTKIGPLPSEGATTSISSYRIVDSVGTTTPPVLYTDDHHCAHVIDNLIDKIIDKVIDNIIDNIIDNPVDILVDKLMDKLIDNLIDNPIDNTVAACEPIMLYKSDRLCCDISADGVQKFSASEPYQHIYLHNAANDNYYDL